MCLDNNHRYLCADNIPKEILKLLTDESEYTRSWVPKIFYCQMIAIFKENEGNSPVFILNVLISNLPTFSSSTSRGISFKRNEFGKSNWSVLQVAHNIRCLSVKNKTPGQGSDGNKRTMFKGGQTWMIVAECLMLGAKGDISPNCLYFTNCWYPKCLTKMLTLRCLAVSRPIGSDWSNQNNVHLNPWSECNTENRDCQRYKLPTGGSKYDLCNTLWAAWRFTSYCLSNPFRITLTFITI